VSIKEQLMDDLKTAMREKDLNRKQTVTMLRAAVKQVEVDTREEILDEQIVEIVQKQIKQKKAAYEEFKKGDREDLMKQTLEEIAILEVYLPEQLSVEEVRKLVEQAVEETGANSMRDMGRVMGILKEKTAGRADGKTLSDLVKEILSN
jgi:uncharacterized protein YqeY